MLVFAFWLMGIALIVAQTTLLQYLPAWLIRPDFIFILVAFIAYRFAWVPGILLVFTLGWVMDVVAGIHLGIYPLTCLLVFSALKGITDKSPIKESTYQLPLVGLCYFLVQIFFYFVFSLLVPEELLEWSWVVALQRTALVVISSIPLFILFNSLYEYLQKRRLRSKPTRRRPPKTI
jgi:rod shape-determining protein MreD